MKVTTPLQVSMIYSELCRLAYMNERELSQWYFLAGHGHAD